MKVIDQYLTEALIFSQDDLAYKFDDWKSGKTNVLLVLGFAGSGKTTTGKELAKKYKCQYLSTDDDSIKELEKLWEDLKDKHDREKAIEKWDENAHIAMMRYLKSIKKSIVIEGVHLFFWLSPQEIAKFPTIIKGTSHIISTIRAIKRNLKRNKGNEKNLPWYKLVWWTLKDNIDIRPKYNKLVEYLKVKQ